MASHVRAVAHHGDSSPATASRDPFWDGVPPGRIQGRDALKPYSCSQSGWPVWAQRADSPGNSVNPVQPSSSLPSAAVPGGRATPESYGSPQTSNDSPSLCSDWLRARGFQPGAADHERRSRDGGDWHEREAVHRALQGAGGYLAEALLSDSALPAGGHTGASRPGG